MSSSKWLVPTAIATDVILDPFLALALAIEEQYPHEEASEDRDVPDSPEFSPCATPTSTEDVAIPDLHLGGQSGDDGEDDEVVGEKRTWKEKKRDYQRKKKKGNRKVNKADPLLDMNIRDSVLEKYSETEKVSSEADSSALAIAKGADVGVNRVAEKTYYTVEKCKRDNFQYVAVDPDSR